MAIWVCIFEMSFTGLNRIFNPMHNKVVIRKEKMLNNGV